LEFAGICQVFKYFHEVSVTTLLAGLGDTSAVEEARYSDNVQFSTLCEIIVHQHHALL